MANTQDKNKRRKNQVTDIDPVGRTKPKALEVEEAVLGALIIDCKAIDKVVDILTPETFYKPEHTLIYRAMVELFSLGEKAVIDVHTVVEQLRKDEALEDAGGLPYVYELANKVASSAHVVYHAQILAQKAIARKLIDITTEIEGEAYDETADVEDLLQRAEGQLFELSQKRLKKGVTQIDPVIEQAIERLNKAAKQVGGMSGLPSGFHKLDQVTSGWQKSDLIIIAARPAMGKTAFVLSMAKNIAVDQKIPVAVFSLEMSNVQLVNRLIVNVCSIPNDKIKSGQLEPHEWQQLDAKIKNLQGAPLYVDDTANLSILEFQTKARRLKEEHDIQLIIIDYLQLMNASGMRFQSREQEVSTISRSLKGLAKELDIPIIALSQLNRNVENRGQGSVEGKKPQLSDLRESGAIEQDADMVCFIHRPEYYKIYEDPTTHKDLRGVGQIIIAKHRNGATADIDLRFKSEYIRFMNEEDDENAGYGQLLESHINVENAAPAAPTPSDYDLPQQSEDAPF